MTRCRLTLTNDLHLDLIRLCATLAHFLDRLAGRASSGWSWPAT